MAVCCQNLTLGVLSSRSALSVLVGAVFEKFGLFFEQALYSANISNVRSKTSYLEYLSWINALAL
jgi:hypothetical protein